MSHIKIFHRRSRVWKLVLNKEYFSSTDSGRPGVQYERATTRPGTPLRLAGVFADGSKAKAPKYAQLIDPQGNVSRCTKFSDIFLNAIDTHNIGSLSWFIIKKKYYRQRLVIPWVLWDRSSYAVLEEENEEYIKRRILFLIYIYQLVGYTQMTLDMGELAKKVNRDRRCLCTPHNY